VAEVFFHLCHPNEFAEQSAGGEYAPPSLAGEGFVHLTRRREDLLWVAEQFFTPPPTPRLLVLELDSARLGARIDFAPEDIERRFPHVYGPIPATAIVGRGGLVWNDNWIWERASAVSEAEKRLAAMGLSLPAPAAPAGTYVPWVRTGNLVAVAGQVPFVEGKLPLKGKVGAELTPEQGKEMAKVCALNVLAQLKAAVGSLDKVTRLVRVDGFVASASGFGGQPGVLNGASDLFVAALGDAGKHVRVAVGCNELPIDAPVEVAAWAEVSD
jgi:enamine deaminase RidA (YjgF/YER057c/UK114 family)/uncharacterized protein (DUF952 family)